MSQNGTLKLFICYSHEDKSHVIDFTKLIAPLRTNGLIHDWYDRKIIAGQEFQNHLDNNLDDADLVCLLVSTHFLSSNACMKEKQNALALRRKKGIAVIPVIVSACAWLDDTDLSSLLALPTDGAPILGFADRASAWMDVYTGLKQVVEQEIKLGRLEIAGHFSSFLENPELLAKAHSQKDRVSLEDIFVYPELAKWDDLGEFEERESSEKLINEFADYGKILLAGGDQSGKTTLCKRLFAKLREQNYVPIYISLGAGHGRGKMEIQLSRAFGDQYLPFPFDEIDKQRIVPIIDDFHLAKNKERHIQELAPYPHQILIVDDIVSLNIRDENVIKSFTRFKIEEFSPSLRNQLIQKWTSLKDEVGGNSPGDNERYAHIDSTTELVNAALGKALGSGLMPAYPFFILSVISIYETFEKPLDQEITSQGYCYQALIYLYLRKQGVPNDDIDTYINFLTEFAFHFYCAKTPELTAGEFDSFMRSYYGKYNLPIKEETLLRNLCQSLIISSDSFNNWKFCYPYLFYFFVAKYLADHLQECKDRISDVISNLHNNQNAYIAVFMSHHSKNDIILQETIANARGLFEHFAPATLSKEELSFFDEKVNMIVEAVLPPANTSPERERAQRLKAEDRMEKEAGGDVEDPDGEEESNVYVDLARELRRSVKTVEVMGRIIKNRAGSLEREKLESTFEEAMKVHLRILTSFFGLIKDEEQQEEIVEFIREKVKAIIEERERKNRENGQIPRPLDRDKIEKLSRAIFWNLNFRVVYGLMRKIIYSLGSNKLMAISDKVCDEVATPAAFLLKHGMQMWYNKNLQVHNIKKELDSGKFSATAEHVLKHMIVDHCSTHKVTYMEMQKIEANFKISSQRLLAQQARRGDR